MVHHQLFKKYKQPTQMIKIHRVAGPTLILLAYVNGGLGFNLAQNNAAIIAEVVVIMLMVVFVWGCLYLKMRRQRSKDALRTPAAQNFRQGMYEEGELDAQGGTPVPMQSFAGQQSHAGQSHGPPPWPAASASAPPSAREPTLGLSQSPSRV